MQAIATQGLTRTFGSVTALSQLSVEMPSGVVGLVGANGAGKSTLIKILLGLLAPTSGTATVLGLDCLTDGLKIREIVGYMPESECLPPDVSATEFLVHMGRMSGLPTDVARERTADTLRHVGLYEERYRPIGGYSTGMKQRVKLAQALVHDPVVAFLDEPTAGLDPFVQLEFEHLCEETRAEGRTVFISSHQLPEVEHLCDRVGIIREGRLLAVESIADLKQRALRRLEIDFGGSVPADAFAGLPGIRDMSVHDGILNCTVMGSVDALIKTAARFEVRNVRSIETSLEEIFMAYYGSGDGIAAAAGAEEASHAAA